MAKPISLDEGKAHLRVTDDAEDDLIQMYLDAAQQHIEDFTGVTLEPRTIVEQFDGWDGSRVLKLRSWPVNSVSSLTYRDTDYVEQILHPADYIMAVGSRPARLAAVNITWPRAYRGGDVVTVIVEAGYTSPFEVPAALKQAILLLLAHFYTNREVVTAGDRAAAVEVPMTVETLCRRYRLKRL